MRAFELHAGEDLPSKRETFGAVPRPGWAIISAHASLNTAPHVLQNSWIIWRFSIFYHERIRGVST